LGRRRISTSGFAYMATETAVFAVRSAKPCFAGLLVFGLPLRQFAWHPPLHTPYISSPNHYLLFAAHAHTITTCFAVVPRLCHLFLQMSFWYASASAEYVCAVHAVADPGVCPGCPDTHPFDKGALF